MGVAVGQRVRNDVKKVENLETRQFGGESKHSGRNQK